MDVSAFLKSFRKTVSTGGSGSVSLQKPSPQQPEVVAAAVGRSEEAEAEDIIDSASDEEAEESSHYLTGRSGKSLAAQRYNGSAVKTKRNQEFTAVRVLDTNEGPATGPVRHQRKRALLHRAGSATATKQHKSELVAAIRSELTREKEKLSSVSIHLRDMAAPRMGQPIENVEASMIRVDDLLNDSTGAPVQRSAALSFVTEVLAAPSPEVATTPALERLVEVPAVSASPDFSTTLHSDSKPVAESPETAASKSPVVREKAKKRTAFQRACGLLEEERTDEDPMLR